MAVMLYRQKDGAARIHSFSVEARVFGEAEVEEAMSDGWYDSPAAAVAAGKPKKRRGRPPKAKMTGHDLEPEAHDLDKA